MNQRSALFALLTLFLAITTVAESPDTVVAVVAGKPVTLAEVDANGESQVKIIKDQLHWAREAAARELIARRLLEAEAKERGLTVSELEEKEIASKIVPVTPDDVAAFWAENPGAAPAEQRASLGEQLKSYLELERSLPLREALLHRLSEKHSPGMKLNIPSERIELDVTDRPAHGPAGALVTLVTFTDYQCAGCAVLVQDLKVLEQKFAGHLRVVHVDFPSVGHERGVPAAVATRCAGRFGKYWEYHDAVFTDTKDLSDERLDRIAADLGIDAAGFSECRAMPELLAEVEADKELGLSLGVTGTPHVYMNGLSLDGGLNTQRLGQLIAMDLDRLGARPPAR